MKEIVRKVLISGVLVLSMSLLPGYKAQAAKLSDVLATANVDHMASLALQKWKETYGAKSSAVNAVDATAMMQTWIEEAVGENQEESEYANLAIADVNHYVNVRSGPGTDSEIVGKMYDGSVAQIQTSVMQADGEWLQVLSGNVEGYIKAEFFIRGDDAAAVVDEYVRRYATVQVQRLNVRKEDSTDQDRIGYIDLGEKVRILEDCGEWLRIQYTEDKQGYVSAQYVSISEEFTYAISIEEEKAALAAQREKMTRQQASEEAKPEETMQVIPSGTTYTSNEELRREIVAYAMQYLGNKYVSGGSSLENGTDCSGFTCFVYANFGYSISRTPGGQYSSAGRAIDISEIQPGDIICYSTNGGKSCTHVGLYIGDGQIIHSANPRKGVVLASTDVEPMLGVRNVID